jgi:hypothetical protein
VHIFLYRSKSNPSPLMMRLTKIFPCLYPRPWKLFVDKKKIITIKPGEEHCIMLSKNAKWLSAKSSWFSGSQPFDLNSINQGKKLIVCDACLQEKPFKKWDCYAPNWNSFFKGSIPLFKAYALFHICIILRNHHLRIVTEDTMPQSLLKRQLTSAGNVEV